MSILVRGVDPGDGFWAVGAIALAASQAIDAIVDSPCSLKWPNDVMLGPPRSQKKVAGVLAHLVDDAVVVGIGINVNWPIAVPPTMSERGTAINSHRSSRRAVERAPLAADVVLRGIGHLETSRSELCAAWKARCSTLGQRVRLDLDSGAIVGRATNIAPDGALQIEENGVTSTHQVGDVVHLRPTT